MCLKQTKKSQQTTHNPPRTNKHAKMEKQNGKTDQDFDLVGPEDWKYWNKSLNMTPFISVTPVKSTSPSIELPVYPFVSSV